MCSIVFRYAAVTEMLAADKLPQSHMRGAMKRDSELSKSVVRLIRRNKTKIRQDSHVGGTEAVVHETQRRQVPTSGRGGGRLFR